MNKMIKTTLSEKSDRIVMYFEGRIDTPDAEVVKKDMQVLYDYHDQNIELDLTQLKYICSSGLRLFLALLQGGRANHCNVTVVGLSPYLHRVFDETGFTRLFKLD